MPPPPLDPFAPTLSVPCPECGSILVIDRKTGAILEHRKPLLDESERTGDRFEDARKKVLGSKDKLDEKVEAVKRQQSEKMARLESLFKERKKEIQESGEPVTKPDSPFDLG